MTTRRARSETGGSSTGEKTGRGSRQQQHGRHSARSMQSMDSQNMDVLSITGSTIDVSRGSSLRELQVSSEGFMTKVSKKPASPRPKIAAAFKTSQSQKVTDPRQRGSSAKNRPKPAWLAGSHETPRSEVSELMPNKLTKPSLADFLDGDDGDRSYGVVDEGVERRGTGSALSKVSEEGRPEPLPEMCLPAHTHLLVDNFRQPKALQDKVTEREMQGRMEVHAAERAREINSPPGEPERTFTAPLHIRPGRPKPKLGGTEEERMEKAAKLIQLWYRRFRNRRKAGEAALRRLMDGKRQEMESRLTQEKTLMSQDHAKMEGEQAKKKRREEKARQARLAAIEELRSKREGTGSDKGVTKKKLTFLQPSGKVTKEKTKALEAKQRNRTEGRDALALPSKGVDLENRPTTASSVGRKVNAIFEESLSRSSKVGTDADLADGSEVSVEESVATLKGSKTTYEDLMSTLKELESNPVEPTNVIGIRAQGYEERRNVNAQTSGVNYSVTTDQDGAYERTQETLLTADKLKTIMNFLDEVERAEEDIRSEVTRQSRDVTARSSFPAWEDGVIDLDKEITPSDSASQVVTDIDNAITAQKQELSRKNESLNMLQKALQQQKEFSSLHVQEVEKEYREQISIQRKEYEATIQRHLSFIDQLIDDKKALSSRCETLVKKLKETDEKYTAKIKKMEEDHAVELKKQKELMEAAEKLRREKWVQEKTKQIKEMTVKGLEPDIQRLIAKHKADIKKLKAVHQGELLEADERAGRKYIRQIEETRERLEAEKDAAVQKERDNAKQRFEKQLEQEEENYQQQRRRLYAEVQEEKERVSQQIHAVREELREEKDASQSSSRQSIMRMQEEHQKATEEMERRHITELNNMKEQLDIEKQQWIENHMKKQEVYLASKERELKEGVREARDKEIEMVIARLEEETARAQEENAKASENRIKRIVEKYENEMKELERSEKVTQDKYNKLKVQIQEQEGEDLRLMSQIKQKEQEVVDMKRLTDQLQQERGKVSDIIRQEFADRLVTLEEDNRRLRTEMSEMRARHRLELDRIGNEKEMEMEEVHKRVKQAVSKKEETTSLLRQQLRAAEKRAEQLEMLLAEQRKKLLS